MKPSSKTEPATVDDDDDLFGMQNDDEPEPKPKEQPSVWRTNISIMYVHAEYIIIYSNQQKRNHSKRRKKKKRMRKMMLLIPQK